MSLSHLSAIGLRGEDKPQQYRYGHTVKSILSDASAHREVSFIGPNLFQITIAAGEYTEAIFNDLYFGSQRINQQCRNIECLLDSNAQSAWILVTAYYAAYFMANDISKVNGRFIINLSEADFLGILSAQQPSLQNGVTVEANNPFFVIAEHGQMSGEIVLTLKKSSPKPHQIAWSNFSQIAGKIKITDERLTYLTLLQSIVSAGNSGWETPSTVRNTWNYSQSNYYGEKGDEVGKIFSSIIKSPKSAFSWARNNNLKPSRENLAASVAYVYHILKLSHYAIINRLKIA
ncbi:hypothetical protein [Ideonella margarita]|uniref:Uncharacterized protein n=1 Tax=Ideonella margarita TaxID=2984191 RepID=A0ABU9C5P6_9BURK